MWRFLKKLKIEVPYDPAIPHLGIKLKKPNANSKRYIDPNVHNSIIYSCYDMEKTHVSINRGMDKADASCMLSTCSTTELQPLKDICCMIPLICRI